MKCQQIIFKTFLLLSLSLLFTGCNEEKKEEVKASLPEPKWEEKINEMGLSKVYLSSNKDPIAATKIGYAYSEKLQDYNKALQWYKYSNSMKPLPENSNYACYALQQLKQYDKAIPWCQEAIKLGSDEALFQLATTYFKINDYEKSLEWFLKAYEKGNKNSYVNIALIYSKQKNYKEAEKWYKKAIANNDYGAYQDMAVFYHDDMKDDIKASAYAIAVINTKYTKSSVLRLLQDKWQIPNETIQKGYELQLNSKEFPVKFKGELDLE